MAMAVGLTAISWAAIPLIYILLKKKNMEEEEIRKKMAGISLSSNFDEKKMKKWEKENYDINI